MIKHEYERSFISPHGFKKITYEIGFFQITEWINTNYMLPKKSGEYIISDKYGNISRGYYTNNRGDNVKIYDVIFGSNLYRYEPVIWSDGSRLISDEIVNLCTDIDIWYNFRDNLDHPSDTLIIYKREDWPCYWMDQDAFRGPTEYDKEHSSIHKVSLDK